MKRIVIAVTVLQLLLAINTVAQDQVGSQPNLPDEKANSTTSPIKERGRATLKLSEGTISIDYGRPSLNGRSVESVLKVIKPGAYWIMGSGKATRLDTYVDLKFGDTVVKRGKYLLRARKISEDQWVMAVNAVKNREILPLVEVPMRIEKNKEPVDRVTIKLEEKDGRGMIITQWGDLVAISDFEKAKL